MAARSADGRLASGHRRSSHRSLPHTADIGIQADGPDLPLTFAEAALAIAGLTAEIPPGLPSIERRLTLEARDLTGLAYAWLNELVSRVDLGEAIAGARVEAVEVADGGPCALRATLTTVSFRDPRVRRRDAVKSATYHGLEVVPRRGGGWRLTAYLDV